MHFVAWYFPVVHDGINIMHDSMTTPAISVTFSGFLELEVGKSIRFHKSYIIGMRTKITDPAMRYREAVYS